MIDVTGEIQQLVSQSKWNDGVLTIFIPHTTAAITIQENADPDVQHDLLETLQKLVPWKQSFYQHAEGNSSAHLKTSLVGSSTHVIVAQGKLQLGTWQGIYFCEFDGPRERKVWLEFCTSV